ncbi:MULTISPECIES: phage tail sheath C-terminal domain-containing protein [unclassified Variovorax]|uniref:phage tail sheath C-terminal domain-containing protein n=1 Tax=unclassified Variovorax TaxID=663243 RepID=UPI003F48D57D
MTNSSGNRSETRGTLAPLLNAERLTMGCGPGTFTPAEEVAAGYAAAIAGEEDPARPLNTLPLPNVAPPPIASRLLRTEQESALNNGVTPLQVGPGEVVQIVRAITNYILNPGGVNDISWLDLTTIRTMDYVAKACRERIELRFPRDKLSARTPAKVRSELLDVLYKLEELEIIENVDLYKDALIVERDSQDPNRLNAKIPVDVVNGLHVFAGRLDLLL